MNAADDSNDKLTPKPASYSPVDILIWTIIGIQVIVAVFGLVVLPDTPVPIHWGGNGQPDGYASKWLAMSLYPLMSIALYVLLRVLLVAGPRLGERQHATANLKVAKTVLAGIMLFALILQLASIAHILGVVFDMPMVIMLAVSVLFIFTGNYMGKLRRNFWMGIRTPWSLANAVVWERVHRLGGWLFVGVGLIGVVCSFIPPLRLWGIVVPLIALAIFLYIYSYICYRQQMQGEHDTLSPPFDAEN